MGYPTIFFAAQNGADKEAVYAAQAIAKYAGFVVLDTFAPELVYPLLVLRENIYTDPQKPIQVQPGVYEINSPKADSPVLVTTNFSITYFAVANEVEGSGLPAWLVVTDAEGMSVLTAWAAGKFDAERIAKAIKSFNIAEQGQQQAHCPARPCRRTLRRSGRGTPRLGDPRRPARGSRSARIYEAGTELIVAKVGTLETLRTFVNVPTCNDIMEHTVTFTQPDNSAPVVVKVPTNTLLADAAHLAGIEIGQPCGGQGRCGRCAVQVMAGDVRRRSTVRLSPGRCGEGLRTRLPDGCGRRRRDLRPAAGEDRAPPDHRPRGGEVTVPAEYEYLEAQTVRRIYVQLTPPSMDDQTDDWSRLQTALRLQHRFEHVTCSLSLLQRMGGILRDGDWNVTAVVDVTNVVQSGETSQVVRLIDLQPGFAG